MFLDTTVESAQHSQGAGISSRLNERTSLGLLKEPEQNVKDRQRYRCADLVRIPMGHARELVYARSSNSARILPKSFVEAVSSCRSFKSIEEHATFITDQLPASQRALNSLITSSLRSALPLSVSRLVERLGQYAQTRSSSPRVKTQRIDHLKRQLVELLRDGILVEEPVVGPLPGTAGAAAPKIGVVGIVTCNRTKSLVRCLTSFIENNVRHGRNIDYVVMDDSPSARNRSETRRILTALASSYAVQIAYAGKEEKQAFCQELIREGSLPPQVVEFALLGMEGCGVLTGANRNGLLLHNVGKLFLSVDDDTVCRLAAMPQATSEPALDSRPSFFEFSFFNERNDALLAIPEVDGDILMIHEELLGRRPFTSGTSRQSIDLNNCSPSLLASLDQPDLNVAVTFTGMLGDSAMQMPVAFLRLSLPSHRGLLACINSESFNEQNREILRGVTRPTVTDNIWCMSTAVAFDNRKLLPPFMPVQRNQDGVFGLTLRRCFEQNLFGHVPWVLLHDPPEVRAYPNDYFWKRTRTSDCIAACIMSLNFLPGFQGGATRLQALGQHLMEIGSLPLRDFEEFLRIQLWKLHSAYLSTMETHLQTYQSSSAVWATNLRNHLENITQAITEADYVVPQTLLQGRTEESAKNLLRTIVFRFGELLWWWPRIDQTARICCRRSKLVAPLTTTAQQHKERTAC